MFWFGGKRGGERVRLDQVWEKLIAMEEQGENRIERLAAVEDKITAGSEQVQKLSRFQYKSVQDTQARLDKLEQTVAEVYRHNNEKAEQFEAVRVAQERRLSEVGDSLIRWLDDIDHLLMNLPDKSDGQDGWGATLRQWEAQLLVELERLDIRELDVLNRSFDPRVAESLGTISLEDALRDKNAGASIDTTGAVDTADATGADSTADAPDSTEAAATFVPFQVMKVVRRGYAKGRDTVLRKANVITLQYDGRGN
ncbi:hypothetical protein ACF3MZ_01830 [Paenibacillaceae bacterium WGS1546]|uniref:hypothetical protein n=1 Tax=Cohnella sp. WGS1546 TaxID=3366810 RepID=UPI00372D6AED